MGGSRASGTWATVLRSGLRLSLAQRGTKSGWRVSDLRGRTRLTVDAHDGRHQILLPMEWSQDQADVIRETVLSIHDAYRDGLSIDRAVALTLTSEQATDEAAPVAIDWPDLVERFKARKLSSGSIKPQTWVTVYQRRMAELLATLAGRTPPANPRELLDAVTSRWADQPGSRGRQLQVQQTAALLRWGVDNGLLDAAWAPPLELDPFVGRKREAKAITTPMEVRHILELVEAIPDPRWRFAFQLLVAYGLRPEELQHLQLRGERLWCNYRKNTSRGETKPRVLRLLPCDDWAEAWKLVERFETQPLPPMRPGYGAEDLGLYMRRRRRWRELRQEYEAAGEKLVLYSARHSYAHRAHLICELPPKVAAAAMGHSVETHLAAYSKWCGDDVVDDAFEKAASRLRKA
jgi:integrase